MLIDGFMPRADATETHRIRIDAPKDEVYAALWKADLGSSAIVQSLAWLRSLPAKLFGPGDRPSRPRALTLQSIVAGGFGKLAEAPGEEVVLGVSGRFWRPVDNLLPFRESDFSGPVAAGTARAVWNFSLVATGPGSTQLTTETRILCGDAASRRKFLAYWLLIRPFSGLIRIVMLRAIADHCAASR